MMTILRQTSATRVPSSAWRRLIATCPGEYRELFMGRSFYSVRLDHSAKLAFQLDQDSGSRSRNGLILIDYGRTWNLSNSWRLSNSWNHQ